MKAFIGVIAAQFFGYAFTISLFGSGAPWKTVGGSGFLFWALVSPVLLIALVVGALIVTHLIESASSDSKNRRVRSATAYLLFGSLGLYALGFTVFSWAFDGAYKNFTMLDLMFVLLIPGLSFFITSRFLRVFRPRQQTATV